MHAIISPSADRPMKNNATSVGALSSVRWLHTVLNRDSSQLNRSVTPSDAARRIRSAIFAFVAGVRLATAICSTATSRTNRIVEINSGSKFDGISFDDDDDFSTRISC